MALDKATLDAYIQALYDDDGQLSSADYQLIINFILSNGEPATDPRDLFQVRRGDLADLPALAQGEPAFTLDTEDLYIGGLNGNVNLSAKSIATYHFEKDCGGVGDGTTNNADAFVKLAELVNDNGGNCVIFFPPKVFAYQPDLDGELVKWRESVEFVDVKNVMILGYGAEIKQVKKPEWTTASISGGDQEGAINFRQTSGGGVNNIVIAGLKLSGDRVPYNAASDGNIFGVVIRGGYNVTIKDVEANGWGTDGVYVGTGYTNLYPSKFASIINCKLDNNTRQGISIAGCDDVNIEGCVISNTNGGSFGHAIDLEPNAGAKQYRATISNCHFIDNERGMINAINTNDIVISNGVAKEGIANGAIYCDGGVDNFIVSNCNIETLRAALYILGDNITNFKFHSNNVKTTGDPFTNATLRINADGSSTGLDKFDIRDNIFNGTGGIVIDLDGELYYENNKHFVSLEDSADPNCFDMFVKCKARFTGNHIKINDDVAWSDKFVYVEDGVVDGNKFESHVGAKCNIRDNRGSGVVAATLLIGENEFSSNFYYKGESSNLDVTTRATIMKLYGGRYKGVQYREVHGGYTRVNDGLTPQRGDVTFSGSEEYGWYCDNALIWRLVQKSIRKGSTGARPSSLDSSHLGLQYLDTTLNANGQLITWNGTAWVDSVGTLV